MAISGIYEIRNRVNGHRYIGGTCNTYARWHGHRGALRRAKHPSRRLQAAWDEYGEDAFVFRIVEEVERPLLRAAEQRAIDRLCPEYNTLKTVPVGQPTRTERGADFLATIEDAGISQLELARRVGVSDRTVRYWIANGVPDRMWPEIESALSMKVCRTCGQPLGSNYHESE